MEAPLGTETVTPVLSSRPSVWQRIAAIGPGLVFLAAAIGPQSLVTNATAGITNGYGFLWALALSVLARYIFLETTARYVLATGESLIEGFARFGRWALCLILAFVFVRRHVSNLYQLLLMGLTMSWLIPVPGGGGAKIWSVLLWGGGFALMYWGRYRTVERWCRPLVILMAAALGAAAILARPDPLGIVKGFLNPTLGSDESGLSATFVLMALLGSAAGSVSNLKYPAFIHEKGWRDPSRHAEQRADLARGAWGLLLMGSCVQIAAAAALPPSAATMREPEELIAAFGAFVGPVGLIIMTIGLWAAVYSTYLASNTGYSIVASDILANLRGSRETVPPGQRPAYRWVLLWFVISPLYALWTDWSPVWVVFLASTIQAVMLPINAILLLALTRNSGRMGSLKNSRITEIALLLLAATSITLIVRNVWDWL
jgi:Mn2+/Fe2+ NRAMP family transporter